MGVFETSFFVLLMLFLLFLFWWLSSFLPQLGHNEPLLNPNAMASPLDFLEHLSIHDDQPFAK